MQGSINSIESCGALDGPGIRCVVFLNQCLLRCKYCHNPETWNMQGMNYTKEELVNKIVRFKPYFKRNNGGVTFSGGEPLVQSKFLLETCKMLKQENIHIALDTAGYGVGNYEEILEYIDLIIYDIKDITKDRYKELTGGNIERTWEFLDIARKMDKKFWIRLVVVPGVHDNDKYMLELSNYIIDHFKKENVEKIEFLPYHKLGTEKYEALNLDNPYKDKEEMSQEKCDELFIIFNEYYNQK